MENISMYEQIYESIKDFPHGLAVYYQGTKISFAKLNKYIERTADIFVNRLGIKPGDITYPKFLLFFMP